MDEDCFHCSELRKVIVRLQEDYRAVQAAKSCPRCEDSERQLASVKGRFNRETERLKSELDLHKRRFTEQMEANEALRQAMEERVPQDVGVLLDKKDQEIKYLKAKLEEHLGKRSEETQEEPGEGTRFSLLEVD